MAHDFKICDKRYVTWLWLAGILVMLVASTGAIAWSGGRTLSEVGERQAVIETKQKTIQEEIRKIDNVQRTVDKILEKVQ